MVNSKKLADVTKPVLKNKQEEINNTEKKTPFTYIKKNPIILDIIVGLIILSLIAGIIYLNINSSRIYIENAQVEAPIISLAPTSAGVLEKVYVEEGDHVSKSKEVALVSGKPLYPETNGIVISVTNTPGQIVSSQTPIVQMIDPRELKIVAKIPENKGLNEIKEGQKVIFTVDAFSGKKYNGYVSSIAPSSRQADIVFSISNARAENDFNIYIKYDINKYPELKNGMSAKVWVYK